MKPCLPLRILRPRTTFDVKLSTQTMALDRPNPRSKRHSIETTPHVVSNVFQHQPANAHNPTWRGARVEKLSPGHFAGHVQAGPSSPPWPRSSGAAAELHQKTQFEGFIPKIETSYHLASKSLLKAARSFSRLKCNLVQLFEQEHSSPTCTTHNHKSYM